jgi:two-component sensor histidine kinase
MRQYLNWKSFLVFAALTIVGTTLFYTNRLATRLSFEEKKNVQHLADGFRIMANGKENPELFSYILGYMDSNTSIPVIMADESGEVIDYKNVDTGKVNDVPAFLKRKMNEFKAEHEPIVTDFGTGSSYIYYGESYLLRQLRYFPSIQMTVIILFLIVVIIAVSTAHRSMQNQVWVGLSKETAHQLGTPLSSITGWLELLKDNEENLDAVHEMQKDLSRLQLVADRFSKVGSAPQLEEENLMIRLHSMVDYMQKRSPSKVSIRLTTNEEEIPVNISGPLFDWVIENLIRNALDAMDGVGEIKIEVLNYPQHVTIDLSDTGKGIVRHQMKKVFTPGFTTKKRGWGLGLSLARRIIKQYHHGSIFVKNSEPGKGTTFRIILRR